MHDNSWINLQSKKRTARTDLARELGRKQRKLILELTLSSDTRRKNGTDYILFFLFSLFFWSARRSVVSLLSHSTLPDSQISNPPMLLFIAVTAEKQTLVRARKHRKYEVQEMRLMKERSGIPITAMPPLLTTEELEEDLHFMGVGLKDKQLYTLPRYLGNGLLTRPSPCLWIMHS